MSDTCIKFAGTCESCRKVSNLACRDAWNIAIKMRLVKRGSYRPGCTSITDGKDRWPRPSGARNEELVCKWHIVLSKAQNASHEVTSIG